MCQRGEKKIGPYRVDGYICDQNTGVQEVFEFFGCYYHGCQKCYSKTTLNVRLNKRMGELFGETLARAEWFRKNGFTFTSIWGCEFTKMLEQPGLLAMKDVLKKFDPLNPRDSFFGGRTEHFRSFWVAASSKQPEEEEEEEEEEGLSEESMQYLDFTSLYPFVNATKEYPIGHPDLVISSSAYEEIELDAVNHLWGLVTCSVLPPQTLLIPVLPMRMHGKLMFPLCKTCCEETIEHCTHTVAERSFWGTFCTPELLLALQHGYTVIEISEIWHWKRRTTDLFKEYIKTFLKSKTEASGWPAGCEIDMVKRREYLDEFEEREGVKLDEDNVEKNEGLRFISKLLLNSFWGYLGMRDNLAKVEYVNSYDRLSQMFSSNTIDVEDACVVGEDLVMIQYKDKEDFVSESLKTNVVLASFTTSHARCCLYEVIRKDSPYIIVVVVVLLLLVLQNKLKHNHLC